MSSNIDHEALIEKQILEEKQNEMLIQKKIEKELQKEKKKDSYFVRKLENNKEVNSGRNLQINPRSNIEIIPVNKPYTFEEIRDFKVPELRDKKKLVEEEDVEEYLKEKSKNTADNIRLDSIYMEALKYGTQSGLYYRSNELQKFIETYESEISKFLPFNALLLANGKVVPPVIVESKNNVQNQDRYTLRISDRSYKIIEQVRVVNTPLTWRDYITFASIPPVLPDDMLLPLNPKEDHYWKMGVAKGWETGVAQANSIYLENIRRAERDFIGMVRYHLMQKRNLVTSPITSSINLGITGNDENMNVNEVLFNIDQVTTFNKEGESWNALPELPDFLIEDPFNIENKK